MPTQNDYNRASIAESEVSTARLAELALTLHTRDFTNELWGRSHAWYAIAHTQEAAHEFLYAHDAADQRRMASSALAMAGWSAEGIAALS